MTLPVSELSQGRRMIDRSEIAVSNPAGHAHAPAFIGLPTRHVVGAPHEPGMSSTWNAPPKSLSAATPEVTQRFSVVAERIGTPGQSLCTGSARSVVPA